EGARVVCADRVEQAAEETAALERAAGAEATVVVGDVRAEDECAAVAAAGAAAGAGGGGGLEGVVLNVGIGRGGGLAGTTVDDWDVTFAVNLRGHFLVARGGVPRLPAGGSGGFAG